MAAQSRASNAACTRSIAAVAAFGRASARVPVPVSGVSRECRYPAHGLREGGGFARKVTVIELGAGGAAIVGVQRDQRCAVAVLVGLSDPQQLALARRDVPIGQLEARPAQGESIAPRREDLGGQAGRAHVESHAQGLEMLVTIELEVCVAPAVDQPETWPETCGDTFPVARGPRLPEPVVPPRLSVYESGCRGLGRQLVEGSERLVLAVDVEHLEARHETVGAEDPEEEERPFENAAAGPGRADVRLAGEERVGPQGEDLVDAVAEVFRELEQRAQVLQRRF